MTDRKTLIRLVRRDRARGMTQKAVSEKHGVTPGFVQYHTIGKRYEHARQRLEREKRVDVQCCVCGDPATVTLGALKKREREDMGPYRCRSCGQYGRHEVPVIRDTSWMRPEEILEGDTDEARAHSVRHWAWRVVKQLTPKERRAIASMDIEAIRNVDESRPARHASPKRERQEFRAAPYAKLEQPFGAALRGEREAA